MADAPVPSPPRENTTARFSVKRVLFALVIGIPLIFLLASGFGRDPSAVASPLISHPAPNFVLRSLTNQTLSLAPYLGRPVVLNFSASWCVGCKLEHPYLVDAWRRYSPRGVVFIGVLFNDTPGNGRAFMRKYGGGWPVLRDPGDLTAIDYGVYGLPETYFIDKGGIVRFKSTGMVTPALLEQNITHLLSASNRARASSSG